MLEINPESIKIIHNEYKDNPVKERLSISALICSAAKEFSNELVVVGGSAVEFYTAASYMTKDIDFIAKDDFQIAKLMRQLGFKIDEGYTWYHPDTSVVIEFPQPPLSGDIKRTTKVETEYGIVEIIGIEDIILDRIKGRAFWQDNNSLPEMMLLAHYDKIDFAYLHDQAKYELVEDVLNKAIKDVEAFKSGQTTFLRDTFYSDQVVEAKIIDALEYYVPLEKIIKKLSCDEEVKGRDEMERAEYLNKIVSASKEIQELINE